LGVDKVPSLRRARPPPQEAEPFSLVVVDSQPRLHSARIGLGARPICAIDDADVGVKHLLVAFAGLEREWESA